MSEHKEHEEQETYMVVINHEEQYSIWSAEKTIPAGWHAEGKKGQRDECLQHIEKVWVDMRPLSLRKTMEGTS